MAKPFYETADMMVNRINMYFDRINKGEALDITPVLKLQEDKPTITGLTLFLGFSSVSAFKSYATRSDEFAEAVAYGYLMIENHYEHLLQTEKLTKAGEVGLRRVGEWRDSIDLALSGNSAHNIFIQEAVKKWQELRVRKQEQEEQERAQMGPIETVETGPAALSSPVS